MRWFRTSKDRSDQVSIPDEVPPKNRPLLQIDIGREETTTTKKKTTISVDGTLLDAAVDALETLGRILPRRKSR